MLELETLVCQQPWHGCRAGKAALCYKWIEKKNISAYKGFYMTFTATPIRVPPGSFCPFIKKGVTTSTVDMTEHAFNMSVRRDQVICEAHA